MASTLDLIPPILSLIIIWYDLDFASSGGCVDQPVEGYILTFSMATWLRVDAYLRITQVLFAICSLCCVKIIPVVGLLLLGCFAVFMIFYNIFFIWWMLVGARMYWGHLLALPECK